MSLWDKFKRKKNEKNKAAPTAKKDALVKLCILVLSWIFCVVAINLPKNQQSENFILNQRSPISVFSEFEFSYIEEELSEKIRIEASLSEPLIFRIDPAATELMIKKVSELANQIRNKTENAPPEGTEIKLPDTINTQDEHENIDFSILWQTDEKLAYFLKEISSMLEKGIISQTDKATIKGEKIRIMDDKQRLRLRPINAEDIPSPAEAAELIANTISNSYAPENRTAAKIAATAFLNAILTNNLIYDEPETDKRRMAAREQVKPVVIDVKKGDVILKKGQIIDGDSLRKYQAYVEEKEKIFGLKKFWRQAIITALLIGIIMIISAIYIFHIHPEIVSSNKKILILAFCSVVNVLINTGYIKLFNFFAPLLNLSPDILPSMLPLAMSSVILSVLIGLRVALYSGLFVAIVTAIQLDNSFGVILNGMIISLISGFAVRYAKNYKDYFIRAVLSISLSMPAIDFLRLLYEGKNPDLILSAVITGSSSGIFIAAICIVILFFVEMLFRIHSNMSLLTLCDYNHPLLKELQMEAPGTYHHSLMVSTLAEQAAREIGANPIAARVCGLFHDIGKISKPEYFTENNLDGINRHQDLNPRISSLVILNHVKEGIALAKKYKLPDVVKEVIEQHHGTDMISFFYKKAVEQQGGKDDGMLEADYKYQGTLPRSKESVIVSLADSSEAASRSIEKPTPNKIDAIIGEIFRKKIRENQLDEADITLKELAAIRKSFVKTLSTMLHSRISYPKDEKENDEPDLFSRDTKETNKPQTKNPD